MEILSVEPRDPRAWRQAIDAVSAFLTEGVFHFSEEGASLASIDPSQIVYVKFEAPRNVFSDYRLASPEVPVPVSLAEMSRILSRLGHVDRLRMSLEDVELRIRAESAGGRVRREFSLHLVDVQEGEFHVNVPERTVRVKLPARIIRDALKDAALFSNSVVLRVLPDKLIVEAKGSGGLSRTIVSPGRDVGIEAEEEAAARYSLPFLQNILKEAEPETEVTLEFATDSPVLVTYSLGGITLSFFLAHMIL